VTNQELNFALEAYRQSLFRDRIGYFGDNNLITAPEVHWDYCGPRMICMERMVGVPMDQIETIKARGIDGQVLLRQGLKVWMEALMVHGPFHGDVHAGNVWVLEDGRGAYLDFGIMGELPQEWKELCKALFYTCMIDQDFSRVVKAYKRIGVLPPDADEQQLAQMAAMTYGPLLNQTLGETSVGQLFKHSLSMVEAAGVSLPKELVLVSKQLLYIERYAKLLAPGYHLAKDLDQIKNIFPDAVAHRTAPPGMAFSHRPQSAVQEEGLSRAS
jgi:predicted unusual protein kinase regulating ubiquinone biosynthesis (AarF/ABC1/UbiB family)